MYLKRLELHGYKSFARKTEFVFDHGITAIVGPNGSGKSNVADALRWALGETRFTQLRARVSDELIFAGSDQRARLGMARVAMTLDNGDQTLPIDFTEVTIERRAYRDGQNEYLLNGTKVRLRDIVELLGSGGLTRDGYTVIGQGLVDRVLHLNPQERRNLIDVAAGIRPLQDKRNRALRQLDETRDNLTRVRDIIAEIEPRLRRLERQAERARQGAEVAQQLADKLKVWYGYQWHIGQQTLKDAQARAQAARARLDRHRQVVHQLEEEILSRRDREENALNQLKTLQRRRGQIRQRYELVQRELAVHQERLAFLERRQQELHQEITELEQQQQELADQRTSLQELLLQLQTRQAELSAQLQQIQQAQAQDEQRKAEYQAALENARRQALEVAAQVADLRHRLATLTEQRARLAQEQTTQQSAIAEREAELAFYQNTRQQAQQLVAQHQEVLAQLEQDRSVCRQQLETAQQEQQAIQEALGQAQREVDRLRARYEALAMARQAGGDETAVGIQAILQTRSERKGIVDSLAALIQVPPEYEMAIEAALGPYLHALVVETWADARAIMDWLTTTQGGRATVIPLEIFQRSAMAGSAARLLNRLVDWLQARGPNRLQAGTAGIIGRASHFVTCDPLYRPLVEALLGRLVLVDSLAGLSPTARRRSFTFATRDGLVLHPTGQITGGKVESTVLRQERVWRELPAQLQGAESTVDRLQAELRAAQARVAECVTRMADLETRIRETQVAAQEAQSTLERAQQHIATRRQEIDWRHGVLTQQDQDIQAAQRQIQELEDQLQAAEARQQETEQHIAAAEAQLSNLAHEALQDQRTTIEKELALAEQEQRYQLGRQQEWQAGLTRIEQQIAHKHQQIAALQDEMETLKIRIRARQDEEQDLVRELDEIAAEIAPVEDGLQTLRQEARQLDREALRARDLLRQAETAVTEAMLEVQRREDRLLALREKIADDAELAAVSDALPQQLMLDLEGGLTELPAISQIPEGLEREVRQLRQRMRQLGSISPEILSEYEETKERYEFLTSQAADLEEAAADLRAVAADLTEIMTTRFTETFEAVAQAFERFFKQLFGGGEAYLALTTEDEESEPGLDVVARPPGKRPQRLALLSGGERSLTAVALLFSLLQVSPTPLCVLDEVDAFLDEANVERFRMVLEELATKTQFILITHNRSTIQAAQTIYGISMGEDGISQAISLKVDEVAALPA